MAIELTEKAQDEASKTVIEPQLVLEIDGVPTVYSAVELSSANTYGSGLLYGASGLTYGSMSDGLDNSESLIVLNQSSTKITQQLDLDKARGSSVSTFKITLLDKDSQITNLISPGKVVDDILGRKAKVKLGFNSTQTSYPKDYFNVFIGIINDVISGPGVVEFLLTSPEQKKKQSIFTPAETKLDGSINDTITTLTVDDTTDFVDPTITSDTSIKFYVRIDDEVIQYTGKTATTLTGCTRAQLSTAGVSHDDNATVTAFYRLEENAMDLACKLMLSGWNGPWIEDQEVSNFVDIGDGTVANAIYFANKNIIDDYGLTVGDLVTTTGASNGANNVTEEPITSVVVTEGGSYIVCGGASFVSEVDTAAVIDFRSQFDTLGIGAKMGTDEVDVQEHIDIRTNFLSSFDYDIYVKEEVEDLKDFIEQEIYKPASAFTLPRKGRSSVGYASPPIPGENIIELNESNILNPDKLKIRRSVGKNFFNSIIYKFDESPINDKFNTVVLNTLPAADLDRIPVGNRPFIIEAKGMRDSLSGVNNATLAGTRRLDRYKFAAEYIDKVEVNYASGFSLEIGDNVVFDGSQLEISDTGTGERGKAAKLYLVVNKTLDIKTGRVTVNILDSGFASDGRWALISPASIISSGISTTQFTIQDSYGNTGGNDEAAEKWEPLLDQAGVDNPVLTIRSSDYSVVGESEISTIVGNVITLKTALAFTPSAGYIMELAGYNSNDTSEKARYAWMTNDPEGTPGFDDGGKQYLIL